MASSVHSEYYREIVLRWQDMVFETWYRAMMHNVIGISIHTLLGKVYDATISIFAGRVIYYSAKVISIKIIIAWFHDMLFRLSTSVTR